MAEELEKLLSEIVQWKNETARYRWWNIFLFSAFKLLIPLGSLAVAASAFAEQQGAAIISPSITLIVAGLVVILSGLDSILNPGARKRVGFKKNNKLRELENRLRVKSIGLSNDALAKLILEANEELKEVLDDYAEKGY